MSFGIALDIDDTLAETALTCIQFAKKEFGIPQELSAEKITQLYDQPGNVPEWQTASIQGWIARLLHTTQFLETIPPVAGAVETISSLHTQFPVAVYITSRTTPLKDVTVQWLLDHGFPKAPVITRDKSQKDVDWKIQLLAKEYPGTAAFIDNDKESFAQPSAHAFTGTLLWFDRYQRGTPPNTAVIPFHTWKEVPFLLYTHKPPATPGSN